MSREMPEHLPPVPEGYVYAGLGEDLPYGHECAYLNEQRPLKVWEKGPCCCSEVCHYAVPDTSDLGRKILAERGKPSWGDAPEWAEWLAQDEDGWWCWYSVRPDICARWWVNPLEGADGFRFERIRKATTAFNWRETLERRPESDGRPLEHKGDVEMAVISRFGDDTPDLIIPADLATSKHAIWARDKGYRIEWDDNGIRGWKE